jgi:hypothetical protein
MKIAFLPDKEPGNGHSCEYGNTHFKRKTAFDSKHISHVGGRGLLLYKEKPKEKNGKKPTKKTFKNPRAGTCQSTASVVYLFTVSIV